MNFWSILLKLIIPLLLLWKCDCRRRGRRRDRGPGRRIDYSKYPGCKKEKEYCNSGRDCCPTLDCTAKAWSSKKWCWNSMGR